LLKKYIATTGTDIRKGRPMAVCICFFASSNWNACGWQRLGMEPQGTSNMLKIREPGVGNEQIKTATL
jgi:hypothetical protein